MRVLAIICILFIQLSTKARQEHFIQDYIFEVSQAFGELSPKMEDDDYKSFLENKYSNKHQDQIIYFQGHKLEKYNPELLFLLTRLIGNKDQKNPFFLNEDFNEKFDLNGCLTEYCIADRIFGKGMGVYYLYFLDRYNLNLSPYQLEIHENKDLEEDYHRLTTFSKEELELFSRSLALLPIEFYGSFNNKETKRVNGLNRDNSQVLANSRMHFYSLWEGDSDIEKVATIFHELAHNFAKQSHAKIDKNNLWNAFSKWRQSLDSKGKVKWTSENENFVSRYARTNPAEDFAESFTAYIINPSFLKKVAPKKYNYLREYVFSGNEFYKRERKDFDNNQAEDLFHSNIDEETLNSAVSSCFDELVDQIFFNTSRVTYKCLLARMFFSNGIVSPIYNSERIFQNFIQSDLYQRVIDEFSKKMGSSVKSRLATNIHSLCQKNILYAIDKDFFLFSEKSLWVIYDNRQSLCRWIEININSQRKEVTSRNYRTALQDILKERMNPKVIH